HAFEDILVAKFEPYPQALATRPGGERLARDGIGVAEFTHKIDSLNVLQFDQHQFAGRVQQLQLALRDEVGGGDVTLRGIAIQLADDNFFVSRRHGVAESASAIFWVACLVPYCPTVS